MRRTIFTIIALCLALVSTVCGCTRNQTGTENEVNVYNRGRYIDKGIFERFEKETGIRVNYFERRGNEDIASLMKKGDANMDVVFLSDYMVAHMIDEGLLEQLNLSHIPNYDLIDDKYMNLEYDPECKYSVAYMTGTAGLIYNSALIPDEPTGWSALFDDRYAGQILMFDNPRDTFGIALKCLGYHHNTVDENHIREAYELLSLQKPLIQAYVMEEIYDAMEAGGAAVGPYYAGDYISMRRTNPALRFVRPVEGATWFVDAMCIPKGARNMSNAEVFINYLCRTEIALLNMDAVMYASANFEAAEVFRGQLDSVDQEIVFASYETIYSYGAFTRIPVEIQAVYDELWAQLRQ